MTKQDISPGLVLALDTKTHMVKIWLEKYQSINFCKAKMPAESKIAIRGPQNCRWSFQKGSTTTTFLRAPINFHKICFLIPALLPWEMNQLAFLWWFDGGNAFYKLLFQISPWKLDYCCKCCIERKFHHLILFLWFSDQVKILYRVLIASGLYQISTNFMGFIVGSFYIILCRGDLKFAWIHKRMRGDRYT